jgi:predicted RNA-binding Zn ribbon-like protein
LPLNVAFDSRGNPHVVPGQAGIAGALGGILSAVARAQAVGNWTRLKVCSMDTCQWAFYDRSKNRSGRWCSMGVCGNRAKTRSYRDRRRSG